MNLPEQVLQLYRKHFHDVRTTIGPDLHAILRHHGKLDKELWHLLNRVVDWRHRYASSLLEPDRFISAFWGVRCDAQNGGFHQYFSNSSGDEWPDLLRLLTLGGDSRGETHFRRVLLAFPDSQPSTDRDKRNQQLDEIDSDYFDSLNSEYYTECFYPEDEMLFLALSTLSNVEFVPDLGS